MHYDIWSLIRLRSPTNLPTNNLKIHQTLILHWQYDEIAFWHIWFTNPTISVLQLIRSYIWSKLDLERHFLHVQVVQCFKYMGKSNWGSCTLLVLTPHLLTVVYRVLYGIFWKSFNHKLSQMTWPLVLLETGWCTQFVLDICTLIDSWRSSAISGPHQYQWYGTKKFFSLTSTTPTKIKTISISYLWYSYSHLYWSQEVEKMTCPIIMDQIIPLNQRITNKMSREIGFWQKVLSATYEHSYYRNMAGL